MNKKLKLKKVYNQIQISLYHKMNKPKIADFEIVTVIEPAAL